MKSEQPGIGTSGVEVTNVSAHGFWLLIDARELFLAFEKFPWFREAPIAHILEVQRLLAHHLHWPKVDVDLHLDSIEHPERYPLLSRAS